MKSSPKNLPAHPASTRGSTRVITARIPAARIIRHSRRVSVPQQAAGDRAWVVSAGSHPKPLHPDAVRVMREYGIDLSGRRSKHLDEFSAQRFDYVITLCDRVREVCPEFPGGPEPVHWSIPDPATAGTIPGSYPAFQDTAADLHARIGFLIQRITPAPAQ